MSRDNSNLCSHIPKIQKKKNKYFTKTRSMSITDENIINDLKLDDSIKQQIEKLRDDRKYTPRYGNIYCKMDGFHKLINIERQNFKDIVKLTNIQWGSNQIETIRKFKVKRSPESCIIGYWDAETNNHIANIHVKFVKVSFDVQFKKPHKIFYDEEASRECYSTGVQLIAIPIGDLLQFYKIGDDEKYNTNIDNTSSNPENGIGVIATSYYSGNMGKLVMLDTLLKQQRSGFKQFCAQYLYFTPCAFIGLNQK